MHTLLLKKSLENYVFCFHRRRLERERIGLCGVPDVWGKVHEEDHPQELVICFAVLSFYVVK